MNTLIDTATNKGPMSTKMFFNDTAIVDTVQSIKSFGSRNRIVKHNGHLKALSQIRKDRRNSQTYQQSSYTNSSVPRLRGFTPSLQDIQKQKLIKRTFTFMNQPLSAALGDGSANKNSSLNFYGLKEESNSQITNAVRVKSGKLMMRNLNNKSTSGKVMSGKLAADTGAMDLLQMSMSGSGSYMNVIRESNSTTMKKEMLMQQRILLDKQFQNDNYNLKASGDNKRLNCYINHSVKMDGGSKLKA